MTTCKWYTVCIVINFKYSWIYKKISWRVNFPHFSSFSHPHFFTIQEMTSHVDNVFQTRLLKISEERAWDKPWHIQEADIGLAWQCAAERCDLRARGSWLDNWILSSRQHTLDTSMDSANLIRAVSQHYAERLDAEWKYWRGTTLPHLSDVPWASLALISHRQDYPHRDLGLMEGSADAPLRLSCLNHSFIYPFVSETVLSLSVTAARSTVG